MWRIGETIVECNKRKGKEINPRAISPIIIKSTTATSRRSSKKGYTVCTLHIVFGTEKYSSLISEKTMKQFSTVDKTIVTIV